MKLKSSRDVLDALYDARDNIIAALDVTTTNPNLLPMPSEMLDELTQMVGKLKTVTRQCEEIVDAK